MPVDASIALGVRPAQFESPINQMAKMYEMQNAQQSNQLNQMKMDEYKRGLTEDEAVKNAFSKLNRTSPTYEQDRYNAYALKGIEGLKAYAATKKEEAAAEEHGVGTSGKKLSNTEASIKLAKAAQSEILDYPSEAMLTSWFEDAKRKGNYNPETLDNIARFNKIVLSVPAPIDPATGEPDFTARRQAITKLQLEAKDRLGKPGQRDIGGSIQDTMVDPITGVGTVTGTTAKTATPGEQKPTFNQGAWYYPPTAQNPQGVRVGQPQGEMPKLKPGEVWDASAQTVKQVPGSAEYIKQSNLHGTDYNAAKTVVSKMDNAIKKVDEILKPENASGFENNFGGYNAAASRMFSGNTATVRKDIDTLKADMKGAGLELIRAGGSIGALTEREWPMLEAQIDAIDYMLDEKDAVAAFNRVKSTFERIKDQAKDTYQTTWGETQYYKPDVLKGAPPPPPAAPAAPARKTVGSSAKPSWSIVRDDEK